jgi:Ca-activated chloride channel family protein
MHCLDSFLTISKRLFSAMAVSIICISPGYTAGLIVIDSAFNMPRPIAIRPINNHPPQHSHPILKGAISFGLHLQSEEIKVDIGEQIAKTHISQTFVNDTDHNLAGTYLFPLPDDTTFSSFSLHIDGKPVEGKILEANEARQQYEEIVRRMVDPGLLEYADYKTVRARIFPIPAHGTKKVELEYTQILKAERGMLKYRFPLKSENETSAVDQIKIDVRLSSHQGLRTIWSPSHIISSTRADNSRAKVSYLGQDTVPDKDFLLYYSLSNKELAANLLTHKNSDEDGYFMLALTPPVQNKEVVGKDLILVVDTSGSMQGERMEQNKKALRYLINAMPACDNFNIVQFNTDVDSFKEKLVVATDNNKKAALSYINDLESRGGTNIGDALKTANTMLIANSNRPTYLVLMTDGEPTVGETNEAQLLKTVSKKDNVRIFDFGVGYDINTKLLNKLAAQHHGIAQYIEPNENIETVLSQFYDKIKSPVLSNIKITYQNIEVKDIYPKEVTDIFAGSQVLLLGKYKKSGNASVQLTGNINHIAKSYTFPLNFAATDVGHTYLPRLWAMRRIGHLTDIAQQNGNTKEVVDEIISLSKKYGIISEYTSFLVTEPNASFNRGVQPPLSIVTPMMPSPSGRIKADLSRDAVGQVAVTKAKKMESLKQSTALAASYEKDTHVKYAEDKTFVLQNNFWVDTSYDAHKIAKLETITFGSSEYFDLLKQNPSISKYLAVAAQVIFVYKNHAYKIIAMQKS